jgi:hypothetical protein
MNKAKLIGISFVLLAPIALGFFVIVLLGMLVKFFNFASIFFLYSVIWFVLFVYWFDGSEYQQAIFKKSNL